MQAIWISYQKGMKKKNQREDYINNLRILPVIVGETIEQVKDTIKITAKILFEENFIMLLGKGPSGIIAKYVQFLL